MFTDSVIVSTLALLLCFLHCSISPLYSKVKALATSNIMPNIGIDRIIRPLKRASNALPTPMIPLSAFASYKEKRRSAVGIRVISPPCWFILFAE